MCGHCFLYAICQLQRLAAKSGPYCNVYRIGVVILRPRMGGMNDQARCHARNSFIIRTAYGPVGPAKLTSHPQQRFLRFFRILACFYPALQMKHRDSGCSEPPVFHSESGTVLDIAAPPFRLR